MPSYFEQAWAYARDNPRTAAAIAAGTLVAAAPGVVIVPVLAPFGFTAGGVAAGLLPIAPS